MLINKDTDTDTAISTARVRLIPYEAHHVPTYHSWMQDEEIRTLTASEPLSLEEEYAMQRTWRSDGDKLTFIVCRPHGTLAPAFPSTTAPTSTLSALSEKDTSPHQSEAEEAIEGEQMLGDVNLFLSTSDDDDSEELVEQGASENTSSSNDTSSWCTGELELMIAPSHERRKGYGRSAILTFMHYLALHMEAIMAEYVASNIIPKMANEIKTRKLRLKQLRVKIGQENRGSIRLFESLGFARTAGEPNYFGEVELVFRGSLEDKNTAGLLNRWGVEGYTEVRYLRGNGS